MLGRCHDARFKCFSGPRVARLTPALTRRKVSSDDKTIANDSLKIHSRCRAIVSHMYVLKSKVHNTVLLTNYQRRRHPYNTKSNKTRIVKTPGGELRYLHIKKKPSPVKCTFVPILINI